MSREARRVGSPDGRLEGVPLAHARLLRRFDATAPWRRLGEGGEATVYALDRHRVLRVHHGEPWAGDELARAYRRWAGNAVTSFGLPEILDSGSDDGLWWQVVRRLPGRTVQEWLVELRGPDRARLLQAYVDAAFEIGRIESAPSFGELLGGRAYADWADCLRARVKVPDPASTRRLADELPDFEQIVERFDRALPHLYDGPPRLVHVDYFPGNVMATVDHEAKGVDVRISGVLDFAAHSLYGDPLLDVVGAVVMADIATDVTEEEKERLRVYARTRAGSAWDRVFDAYRVFYGLYYVMDEALLPWCVRQLRLSADGDLGR